jgi:hypothetical protein
MAENTKKVANWVKVNDFKFLSMYFTYEYGQDRTEEYETIEENHVDVCGPYGWGIRKSCLLGFFPLSGVALRESLNKSCLE